MSELPALTPQALLARTDQVARIGGARTPATDVRTGDEPDYELELRGRAPLDGVHETEAISAVHGERDEPDEEQRPRHERRAPEPEDDDEPPHLLDVTA